MLYLDVKRRKPASREIDRRRVSRKMCDTCFGDSWTKSPYGSSPGISRKDTALALNHGKRGQFASFRVSAPGTLRSPALRNRPFVPNPLVDPGALNLRLPTWVRMTWCSADIPRRSRSCAICTTLIPCLVGVRLRSSCVSAWP